jgi:peptide/nickel transport system substrate-binding protein
MNQRGPEGFRLAPDGTRFTMITHVPADRADQMPTAELIRAHLVDVGVRLEIEQLESGLAREKGQTGDLQSAVHWVQTPLWITGMDTNYFGADFFCYQWRQYCLTDGEEGQEPDEAGKRLCEIWKERQEVVPLSAEDQALIDELMQIHYDNMWAISIIQNIKRPTIFNQDLRNVAIDGQQMAAVRGGEIWWYDR